MTQPKICLIQTGFGRCHAQRVPDYEVHHVTNENEAFEAFNGYGPSSHLRQYALYSMSVGDIVMINDKFFLCESFGWKELTRIAVVEHIDAQFLADF